MRKIFYLLVFLFVSFVSTGQSRLGYSVEQIRTEFSDEEYGLTFDYNEEGIYFSFMNFKDLSNVLYLFDPDRICRVTIIVPENKEILNTYVKLYNQDYVAISTKEWIVYTDNGINNIKLVMDGDYPARFVWTEEH